jgi:TolB-like protein/DNA-binding SARP family transcriptional activator
VRAETLADSLWLDVDGDSAMRNFHTTLKRLRGLIGQEVLPLYDGRLNLNHELCWVDALEFESVLKNVDSNLTSGDTAGARDQLEGALALYGGPFLSDEEEPPEIATARGRLHGLFLRHVEQQGEYFQQSGQIEDAVKLYERGLEIDDLVEEFYQKLMKSMLELGRIAGGIAVYQRCHQIFQGSMGITPSPETEDIYQELLKKNQDAPPPAEPPVDRQISAQPGQEGGGARLLAKFASVLPGIFPSGSPAKSTRLVWVLAVLAVLMAGAAGVVTWRFFAAPSQSRLEEQILANPGRIPFGKPSIAVLPLKPLGKDAILQLLSAGLSLNIINQLAKVEQIFVISGESSFVYKDRPRTAREIGKEMGVRYLLVGDLEKAGNRIRLRVQLVEAATGEQLWGEKYDRELQDIFAIQDEITDKIITSLKVKLTEGEQERVWRGGTKNIQAWNLTIQGLGALRKVARDENQIARKLFQQAIMLDPEFAGAITVLGYTHFMDAKFAWSKSKLGSLEQAAAEARKAIELDPTFGEAYSLMAVVMLTQREYGQALVLGRKSVDLNPNGAEITAILAMIRNYSGDPKEGLNLVNHAIRLSPFHPAWYTYTWGLSKFLLGNYREAIPAFDEYLRRQPESPTTQLLKVVSLVRLNEIKRAREEADVFRKLFPGEDNHPQTILYIREPHQDPAVIVNILADLKKAGL